MNNKKETVILFLVGEAGVGKDEIAYILKKFNYKRISIADKIKEQYAELNNVDIKDLHDRDKKENHRSGISNLEASKRSINSQYWIDLAFSDYMNQVDATTKMFNEDSNLLVISDIRRVEEINWFLRRKNTANDQCLNERYLIVLVSRPVVKRKYDQDILTHKAIGYLEGIHFMSTIYDQGDIINYRLYNHADDIQSLEEEVNYMVHELNLEYAND